MGRHNGVKKQVHSRGHTDLALHPLGEGAVTIGEDSACIHRPGEDNAKPVDFHEEPITAVAFSPSGSEFITCSEDKWVKMISFPSGEPKNTNVFRSSVPVFDATYSPTGTLIAVAPGTADIKLVSTNDVKQVTTIQGHSQPVRTVTFDPSNKRLASVCAGGSLYVWDMTCSPASTVHKVRGLQKASSGDSVFLRPAWHPKSKFLAFPRGKDIVLLDTAEWTEATVLSEEHDSNVSCVAFSPNGLYLASGTFQGDIVVWDVTTREGIAHHKAGGSVQRIAWSPVHNQLHFVDTTGTYECVNDVIIEGNTMPHLEPGSSSPAIKAAGLDALDADALLDGIDEVSDYNGSDDDNSEENEDGGAPVEVDAAAGDAMVTDDSPAVADGQSPKKRKFVAEDDVAVDTTIPTAAPPAEAPATLAAVTVPKSKEEKRREKKSRREEPPAPAPIIVPSGAPKQAAFQPSSTNDASRRFLAWNMIGAIITRKESTHNSLEIEFNDTEKHKPVRVTDHYRFVVGALGEHGAVFGSAPLSKQTAGALFYKPFDSWAGNSEWTMYFLQDEIPTCVSVGRRFVAACSNKRHMRIFSHTGTQRHIMSLKGDAVSMAATDKAVAVVYHSGPTDGDDQCLSVMIFNIETRSLTHDDRLPLSPGATLKWISFNDEGALWTFDSKNITRMMAPEWDNEWTPILDASAKLQKGEAFWPIGVCDDKLIGVLLQPNVEEPVVAPRPPLAEIALRIPLLQPESNVSKLEDKVLRLSFNLGNMRRQAAETDQMEEMHPAIRKMEVEIDSLLIRHIHACCQNERLVKALDLCFMLNLKKSVQAAIQVALRHRQESLAERMKLVCDARFPAAGQVFAEERVAMATGYQPLQAAAPVEERPVKQRTAAPVCERKSKSSKESKAVVKDGKTKVAEAEYDSETGDEKENEEEEEEEAPVEEEKNECPYESPVVTKRKPRSNPFAKHGVSGSTAAASPSGKKSLAQAMKNPNKINGTKQAAIKKTSLVQPKLFS